MSIMVENSLCTTGRPNRDASPLDMASPWRRGDTLPLGTSLLAQPNPAAVMGR
jgi:hypothetical protein